MADPQEQQQNTPEATGPATDLSTKNFPPGTTKVDQGVAYDITGKALGPVDDSGQAAPQAAASAPVDFDALAKKYGAVGSEPTAAAAPIDYDALAKKYGAVGAQPIAESRTGPQQSHGLLTDVYTGGFGDISGRRTPPSNTTLAQAKNVSDYIYNNILGKDTYQHNNLTYDETPSTAWGKVKQRLWGWLTQDEINKIPGLEPDRVAMLEQHGQDALANGFMTGAGWFPGFGKEKADQLREHLLNGSYVINQPPEVFARAAAKTVSDFFSPGYYALGAFGKIAQGYQKAAQVAAAANDWTKAASSMGKARLLGLLGAGVNVPFAASQAHDLVENWDKMSVPERVAAVSGIMGATINTHVGINSAGGYKKVGGDIVDAASVPAKATAKAVGTMASLGKAQDFNTAIERASNLTGKNLIEGRTKIQNASSDLQAILNRNPQVSSPKEYADVIDAHLKAQEQALQAAAGATQHDVTPVVPDIEQRVIDHLNKFFDDNRGKFGTSDETYQAKQDILDRVMQSATSPTGAKSGRAPNLFESENIRQGLNIDAAPQFGAAAKPTTNAYKAGAFEAAKVMREAIDEAYDNRGIQNVKEFRQRESDLIDIRDRLASAQPKAEAMGNGGLWDALWKKFGSVPTITAIVLGTHNPLAFGALAPYLAADRIYQNVKNPNRNVGRAAKLASPTATPTELSFNPPTTGVQPPPAAGPTPSPPMPTPAPPPVTHPSQANPHPQVAPVLPPAPQEAANAAAAVTPALMEEPPTNHALNAELATHFGEPLDHATIDDRIEHVKNDAEAMRRAGVALTPNQTKVLGAINEHEAEHSVAIEDAQKKSREKALEIAAELHKMLAQEAEEEKKQAEAKSKDVKTKQAAAAPALAKEPAEAAHETTDKELEVPKEYGDIPQRNTRIHEIGHLLVSDKIGMPGISITSHLHPEAVAEGDLAAANSDISSVLDENGDIDHEKVKGRLGDIITRFVAGGVAEELYGGIPFDKNRTIANDMQLVRTWLTRAGRTGPEAESIINQAKAQAREMLTTPEASAIMTKYGEKRGANMPPEYHLDENTTKQMLQEYNAAKGQNEEETGGGTSGVSQEVRGVRGQADTGTSEGTREGTAGVRGEEAATKQKAGLVEKSTGDHEIDAIIRNGGGIPAGVMDMGEFGKIHMFHDPETGSTLGFKSHEKITPQMVGKKLAANREDFAKGEEANSQRQEEEKKAELVTKQAAEKEKEPKASFGKELVSSIPNNPKPPYEYYQDNWKGQARSAYDDLIANPTQAAVNKFKEVVKKIKDFGLDRVSSVPNNPKPPYAYYRDNLSGQARSAFDDLIADPTVAAAKKLNDLLTKQKAEEPKGIAESANEFNREAGRPQIHPGTQHSPELAKRIADAFDVMKHEPENPAVEKSYNALKDDIDKQWDFARDKMGIKFEPWKKEGQPYVNSKEMVADVNNNKHLYFFQGGEIPEDHPLAEQAGEGYSYNDKLRAVHDLFGHAAHNYQFGPKGEENAWNVHRQMFSPEAIPAVTTETRGQNSWVNFGKHLRNAEGNIPAKGQEGYVPPTERPYAQNKAGILPAEFHEPTGDWASKVHGNLENEPAGGINPNAPNAESKRYGFEILPEVRQAHEKLSPEAFREYAKRPEVKAALEAHPDIKLGWDTTGAKPELNIGATTDDLAKATAMANKLDQRALWDNEKKEVIPVAGKGERTQFPEYPVSKRLEDLSTKQKASPKGSSVPLMENPLEVKPGEGREDINTLDLTKALNKFSRKQLPALEPGSESKEMVDRAKKIAEDEAKYQLAQSKTGTEWYTTEMKDHDKVLQALRPELAEGETTEGTDGHPVNLTLFKAAEAILSSGQKPYANVKSALRAWDLYKETGEFPPTNPATGKSWGPRNVAAYGNAFEGVNKLIQEKGKKGAADWLLSEHPVSELKQYNENVSGKKEDMATGAMILGEKRGPFMQNLHGIESKFTADMWVSRTWNRWMGTLDLDPRIENKGKMTSESDAPRNNTERSLMKESFEKAAKKLGLTTSSLQAVLWYYEQGLYRAHGIPVESWSFSDAAKRVAKEASEVPEAEQTGFNFGANEQGGFNALSGLPVVPSKFVNLKTPIGQK